MRIFNIFTAIAATAFCAYAQEIAPEEGNGTDEPVVSSNAEGAAAGNSGLFLGVSYRKFDDFDFESKRMNGYDGFYLTDEGATAMRSYSSIGSIGTNNSHNTPGQSGRYEYVRVVNIDEGYITSNGHIGNGEDHGLTFGYQHSLYSQNAFDIDLVASFQYFSVDTANRASNAHWFDGLSYDAIVWNGVPTQRGDYGRIYDNAGELVSETYKADFEMNLYQLDLGAKLSYALGKGLEVNVAAGPTLGIADISSSSSATYRVSNALGESYHDHDDGVDFIVGCYASAGVAYWFTDSICLAADIRYDKAFQHVSTKYAEMDLDSWGGSLKLGYRF